MPHDSGGRLQCEPLPRWEVALQQTAKRVVGSRSLSLSSCVDVADDDAVAPETLNSRKRTQDTFLCL